MSILRDGSEALRQTLKEIQASHPVGEKLYRSHYGVFFDWLRSRDDDPDFDVVRDVVREFISMIPARTDHRMVIVATSASGRSETLSYQIKNETVMVGRPLDRRLTRVQKRLAWSTAGHPGWKFGLSASAWDGSSI
ncbi:hypothetical protein [Paracoccus haematequi]|uniref:hypothetical protein n=1 Tax=Paracoccus haematequi TaxID=2491866 RepID=UPI000F7D90CD|nr:hypothetical protein [Paracoccus haematequi]